MDFPWVGPSLPERMSAFLREGKAFGFWDHSTGRFAPQIQVTTFADMREIVISGRGLSAALPFRLKRELAEDLCALLPVAPPVAHAQLWLHHQTRPHAVAAGERLDGYCAHDRARR